jgi:hyperosmotically inducible periplasmic protein
MILNTNARLAKITGVILLAVAFVLSSGISAAAATTNRAPQDQAKYQDWLTKQVRHQLLLLPWVSVFDNLEYQVDGNNVTLMGQVVEPVTKEDAANSVKHIEGVGTVTNQIEVLPLSPMDWSIRRAELRTIYGFSALREYDYAPNSPIRIIVKNGNVTLEGVVDNQSDKDLIGLRAKSVPNVFSVTNNLRVDNGK